jgi:hypothetical protein
LFVYFAVLWFELRAWHLARQAFYHLSYITQRFALAKQAFYHLSHTSGPFALIILEMGICKLFARADQEP